MVCEERKSTTKVSSAISSSNFGVTIPKRDEKKLYVELMVLSDLIEQNELKIVGCSGKIF